MPSSPRVAIACSSRSRLHRRSSMRLVYDRRAVERLPIVDAHQHFWDPRANYHPWLCDEPPIAFRYGEYSALRRPYLPADYLTDARGHQVVKTVYVETEWDPPDPLGETA